MERSFCTEALVLAACPFGESNLSITLLSPDRGVFEAVLYGGRKSKLRSLVSPFHSGKAWLYSDTAKKSMKITDFDVSSFHPVLRENLYKNTAASFMVELIVKTQSGGEGGEFQTLWTLANGFLDGLERCGEEAAHLGLLRFLWRYLAVLGVQPDPAECAVCGGELCGNASSAGSSRNPADAAQNPAQEHAPRNTDFSLETTTTAPQNRVYFHGGRQGFVCRECADAGLEGTDIFPLTSEGVRYLNAVNTLSPAGARQFPVHRESVHGLHDLLFTLIERAVGTRLKTLEIGVL